MKNKLLVFIFIIVPYVSNAQLKHYVSLGVFGYYEYFNQEKDKIFDGALPWLSYKIEKDKMGLEAFYNFRGIAYYYGDRIGPEFEKVGGIRQIISSNYGLAFHYNVVNLKHLKINPMAGLVACDYHPTIVEAFYSHPLWNESITSGERVFNIGMVLGANINIPIFKGIFFSSNVRFTAFPLSKYNKQNFILDFGLGYMYQHKKKVQK